MMKTLNHKVQQTHKFQTVEDSREAPQYTVSLQNILCCPEASFMGNLLSVWHAHLLTHPTIERTSPGSDHGQLPNFLNVTVLICKRVLMRWCIRSANIRRLPLYTFQSFIYSYSFFGPVQTHFFLGWKAL